MVFMALEWVLNIGEREHWDQNHLVTIGNLARIKALAFLPIAVWLSVFRICVVPLLKHSLSSEDNASDASQLVHAVTNIFC